MSGDGVAVLSGVLSGVPSGVRVEAKEEVHWFGSEWFVWSLPGAGGGGRGWWEGACVPRGTSGNTPSLVWVWVFALGVGPWSLGNAGVANPYSPLGCALLWAYVGGKIRACGGCSVGAFGLGFPPALVSVRAGVHRAHPVRRWRGGWALRAFPRKRRGG